MPEEVGSRLGGLAGLRASGAFDNVDHLKHGGYWCRATTDLADYDEPTADKIFGAVASALPPGRPHMGSVIPPNVLSRRDPTGQ
jgi:hypothetical protein